MKRRKKQEEIVLLAKHLEDKPLSSVPVSDSIAPQIVTEIGTLEENPLGPIGY